ncbi:hypothetical protein KKH43_04855 [Patescibacteria group bacterium]|nr:hypothetical protein [Patescibacteria group bacterium]
MKELQKIVEEFIKTFGIKWDVTVKVHPGIRGCQIVSFAGRSPLHEILINTRPMLGQNLFDVAHEIVHALFAERIDPLFSGVMFNPAHESQVDHSMRFKEVEIAQAGIDIWINRLREEHYPGMMLEDVDAFAKAVFPRIMQGIPFEQTGIVALAVFIAESHGIGYGCSAIESRLEGKPGKKVRALANLFESLPNLEFIRDKDLQKLQRLVQKVAQILEFAIRPRIVEHETGYHVWTY